MMAPVPLPANGRCGFGEGTFAGTHGNARDAPIPALRGNRIGRTGRALAVTRRCGTYLAGREQHGDPCYSRYDRVEDGLKRFAVSPTPDSTLADPQQIIADLRREL